MLRMRGVVVAGVLLVAGLSCAAQQHGPEAGAKQLPAMFFQT